MSEYKYLDNEYIDRREHNDLGIAKNEVLLEIAYQLKRIADSGERQ